MKKLTAQIETITNLLDQINEHRVRQQLFQNNIQMYRNVNKEKLRRIEMNRFAQSKEIECKLLKSIETIIRDMHDALPEESGRFEFNIDGLICNVTGDDNASQLARLFPKSLLTVYGEDEKEYYKGDADDCFNVDYVEPTKTK